MKKIMNHLRTLYITSFVLALILGGQPNLSAGDNHLDYSFHEDGKKLANLGTFDNDDEAYDVAFQSDGKIVVVGVSNGAGNGDDFCVMRFTADGYADQSFGTLGQVATNFNGGERVKAVAIQPDGKIVVVGSTAASGAETDFAIARYNANGTLDTTFTGDGKVVIDFQGGADDANSVAIQPDGKIVVVGSVNQDDSWGVLRLSSNGLLDASFDLDGKVITNLGSVDENANGVVVLPDGKIIVAGTVSPNGQSDADFALVRYSSTGVLDTSFSTDGKVFTDIHGYYNVARSFTRDNLGRYILAGESLAASGGRYTTIARYTPAGALDTTFNNSGFVVADLNPSNSEAAFDVATDSQGHITVAGNVWSSNPQVENFVLVRFLVNGKRDLRFGTNGRVNTIFGSGSAKANAIAIKPNPISELDDDIVAVGRYRKPGGARDFAIARYNTLGPASVSGFSSDGISDLAVFRPSDGNWYALTLANGAYEIIHWGQPGDIPVPGDYDKDGRTDTAIFRDGVWYIRQSSDGQAIITQFGLPGDKPVQGDYDGDGKSDIAVWRPSDGVWHLLRSKWGYTSMAFGLSGDKPTQGDYDGDGLTDIAVYRPESGVWYAQRSALGFSAVQFGLVGDKPVPADYDGDGRTDVAVYRPLSGTWYTIDSQNNTNLISQFGLSTDIPGPGDYDGDGKADLAVFRRSTGVWYARKSSNINSVTILNWGLNGDIPIAASYIPQ